uniref:right-handed parallel beta-helix repeat-containing protein n=1 Tax=Vaginimicrobium propionicum TaxID=1871034 RepID=UPI000970643F|nr:right-handed parallel beta-helix repeat-containing protein [Vaginimicrobium propionicum]
MEIHVSLSGCDNAEGSISAPLRTINHAAQIAMPGDTVIVHEGQYREWVKPKRGGRNENSRITYQAADNEHVVIKGSEEVKNWRSVGENTWVAEVPNELFGDFNPFAIELSGDWVVRPNPNVDGPRKHLGDVYLNGRSLNEADDVDEVKSGKVVTELFDDWTQTVVPAADPDWTARRWFSEVDTEKTTIWANFGDADPNAELVEINVRPTVFTPESNHIDYITVRGFELCQAATQWAPPTAEQIGLIGPNWAKGWIIENNDVHDSKCSGISLGKERSTGQNFATVRQDKPGYQYQLESVFAARHIGWDKEHIGSHIVRNNHIYDCGQTGIVGHLGCIFSTIENNHIHRIATRREFFGHELAGIKLHAAIDVVLRHNHIHDCTLGTWLDWQTQGTRVSRNVYHSNSRDLFIEVSHGPFVVENNVLASPVSFESFSQGGAFIHNLLAGTVRLTQQMDRATPYHVAHSTQVAGYATFPGGDDRWIGNVFVAGDKERAYGKANDMYEQANYGTCGYDKCDESMDAFISALSSVAQDHERYYGRWLPVTIRDNSYFAGAKPYCKETNASVSRDNASVEVTVEGCHAYLTLKDLDVADLPKVGRVYGTDLPWAYFPQAPFEELDGSPLCISEDLTGKARDEAESIPGPLACAPKPGEKIQIW